MPKLPHWPTAALCAAALIPGCHPFGGGPAPTAAHRFVPGDIGFWSAGRGIALDRHGQVALTMDGGRRWRVVGRWGNGRAGYAPRSLSVSAGGAAAFLAGCGRGACSEIVRSSDGGRSWSTTAAGIRPTALALARSDPHVAWAVTVPGSLPVLRLFRSGDGGRTWRRLTLPCRAGDAWSSPMSLATARRGWLMCGPMAGVGEQPKKLLETTDGGTEFHSLLDIDPLHPGGRGGGLGISGYTVALSMNADGHGLLAEDRADSFWTADGGRSWHPIRHVTQTDHRQAFAAFQLSRRVGYLLVHGAGRTDLYRSTDGNRRWKRLAHWKGQ